jgi:hypothetical protein
MLPVKAEDTRGVINSKTDASKTMLAAGTMNHEKLHPILVLGQFSCNFNFGGYSRVAFQYVASVVSCEMDIRCYLSIHFVISTGQDQKKEALYSRELSG